MPADASPTALLARELAGRLDPRTGVSAPAHAWGVFEQGALVASGGSGDAEAMATRTAFRVASCTKSFTAASALLLADDGLLDLDEPLAEALDVPLRLIGPTGAAPTVRDALSMRAGLPTDDPWADRQESMSDDDFARLLGEGVRVMWTAGERYEYSNLGYAIVGRIIALRARMPFRRVVETRLLEPLGLTETGFDASVGAAGGAIAGFRAAPDGWERLPFTGPGAFSPIGGLFSTVADLSRWCGILAGSIDAGDALAASVSERMRHPHIRILGDPAGSGAWQAYGLGLVVRSDGVRRFLAHSGGYPGFSSFMTWEAGSGAGAVAFENATYAGVTAVVRDAMDAAFDSGVLPEPDAAAAEPWPETVQAAERVRATLATGTLDPDPLFDPCVELDRPFSWRRADLAGLIDAVGGVDRAGVLAHETPARAAWVMRGPTGAIRCSLMMTPHAEPRVQRLDVALLPDG